MGPLWKAVLRFAAEWAVLIALGGALGVGVSEAMRAGWVSERTVATGFVVAATGAIAVVLWAARGVGFDLWDDPYEGDDDPPSGDIPSDGANTLPDA